MKRLVWSSLSPPERQKGLARPEHRASVEVATFVRALFDEVAAEGAVAVSRWALKLDGRAPGVIELTPAVVDAARAKLAGEDIEAIGFAIDQVRFYHESAKPGPQTIETRPGVRSTLSWRPIETCGLYVPNGATPLVSTLIMLAEPARIAGVRNRIVVMPPGADAAPHPALIVAAAGCGLDQLWLIGGAQAIAALTFGAIAPKAQKIFGPGNAYVAEAKRLAATLPDGPAIDLPAGPSELMVIADAAADAAFVAADLLSQAEHDADAQVILVSTSGELIDAVLQELETQGASLPRVEIVRKSLAQGRCVRVRTLDEAAEVANLYAPEHLSLQVTRPERIIDKIENAGAVFIGAYSAETFGDYVIGPSHVLPTDGAARITGGVTMASFMKSFAVQEVTADGIRALAATAARLARLEGLEAHARAADIRLARAEEAPQPSSPVVRRRIATVVRDTRETKITVTVDLDRADGTSINTGIGFFDHMLEQVAQHGCFSIKLACAGDLHIDGHHSIEDCALALGAALRGALGDKRGIGRYGFVLPMDEAKAQVSIDLSGRPYLVFEAVFAAPAIGAYPTEMTEHVFRSLSQAVGAAIHLSVEGGNDHHKTEACFKAFGRALRQAVRLEGADLPSTKGVL